jgi:hypothetical protein
LKEHLESTSACNIKLKPPFLFTQSSHKVLKEGGWIGMWVPSKAPKQCGIFPFLASNSIKM